MSAIRIDLVFSYWIFAWFLLHYFKFTSYSPKFLIIIGIIHNSAMLLNMILRGTKIISILSFITINIFIKILPLYYLRNEPIKIDDIYVTGFVYLLFVVWLNINGENIIDNLNEIQNSILNDKNETPFMKFIEFIRILVSKK
jgi:uncharacterized membrane protein